MFIVRNMTCLVGPDFMPASHARADRYCDNHELPSPDDFTSITNKVQVILVFYEKDSVDTRPAAVNKLFTKLLKSKSKKIREGNIK